MSRKKIDVSQQDIELSFVRDLITRSFFQSDGVAPLYQKHSEVLDHWALRGWVNMGELTSQGKARVRELQYYFDRPSDRTGKLLFLLDKAIPLMKVTPRNRTFIRKVARVLNFHPRDPRDLLKPSDVTRLRNLLIKHLGDYESRLPTLPADYPFEWEIQRLLTNGPVRY
jgi:hypothetical protein